MSFSFMILEARPARRQDSNLKLVRPSGHVISLKSPQSSQIPFEE